MTIINTFLQCCDYVDQSPADFHEESPCPIAVHLGGDFVKIVFDDGPDVYVELQSNRKIVVCLTAERGDEILEVTWSKDGRLWVGESDGTVQYEADVAPPW